LVTVEFLSCHKVLQVLVVRPDFYQVLSSFQKVPLLFQYAERVQKGIAYWDKQNYAVPAPNYVLKVQGEIIKDEGL